MYIVKNILVTTDFSDFSAAAVEHASTLALLYGARIHLLHVIETGLPPECRDGDVNIPGVIWDLESHVQEEMRKFVYWKLQNNMNLEQVIRYGEAYREIVRYAQEKDIDLIVIATHGRSGLAHMLMGSVAERVVRLSPGPVLAVKPLELRDKLIRREDVEADLHLFPDQG